MTKIVNKGTYFEEHILDERGRVISSSFPVDKDGNWLEGYETQWTTYEYEYDNDSHIPSWERHRGWTEGCFWTDWEEVWG